MGDVKMRRENIRYEARGKSFEIECPSGFSGIEAIVCWCDAGGGWHREAFESFLDARGRLDGLLRGEAVMAYVQRTACMNTADAIDPGIQPVEVGRASGDMSAVYESWPEAYRAGNAVTRVLPLRQPAGRPRGGTVAPRLSNNHPRGRSLPVPCRGRGPGKTKKEPPSVESGDGSLT